MEENFQFQSLTEGLGLEQEKREVDELSAYSSRSHAQARTHTHSQAYSKNEPSSHGISHENHSGLNPNPRSREETRRATGTTTRNPFSPDRERPPQEAPPFTPPPSFISNKDSSLAQGTTTSNTAEVREGILFKPAFFSFSSFFVDICVTLGLSLYSFCTALLILQLEAIGTSSLGVTGLLSNISLSLQPSLFLLGFCLWIATHLIYTFLCHCFTGATLGEWVHEVQLGTNRQFRSSFYVFKVLWRYTLMALTGWIFLPLFSWALREDLLGYLSGLSLWQKEKRHLT